MGHTEELTLMRIFISENDRFGGKPLYQALVELFHEQGFSGATVLKGAMGYGPHGEIHSDHLLRLSSDLPVVVEVVESQARMETVLPELERMLDGGLVTLENVRVIRYK
ncbi:MAG: DUF190 domain-containing protein [Deltaproteobacteria bacterium]|jgi:PII-like signaling protein|nr:DUF190 domain-containing protein [Deltaproteobacteria bacterium]MBW2475842.1 DUF190 domain-containing protein [Deltaproteobacteria bacterium]MBW2504645.1 DUF190 domain-containing protein [Deltaproteobacteria bacterium]MBW2520912.1 DUF190 domain-containing protein [Deltaproteobacteria bacterium]